MAETRTESATLGATARWTAAVRARESAREDALLHDPWAAALAGPDGMAWVAQRPPDAVIPMIVRTRFFDDFLQRVTREDELRQVVLMACGLDTRAFRLPWPAGTRVFELDQPAVLAYKEQVLRAADAEPTCERRTVSVDLRGAWSEQLTQSGFDLHASAVWLLEGFLFYLPSDDLTRLLDEVARRATSGSWLGCDVVNSAVLTSPWTRAWIEMQAQSGAPWLGALDDPAAFLSARGWLAQLTQPGEENAGYGRWRLPVIPMSQPELPHTWYVTARKRIG